MAPSARELLESHVSLSIASIDRMFLNGYVPKLQTSGQLVYFLSEHLGYPIPSPKLLHPLRNRFVDGVQTYAREHDVPIVHFERGQRKDDVAAKLRGPFQKDHGIVFIGVAQEMSSSFKARKTSGPDSPVHFQFSRQKVFVNQYYFYVQDREWGPGFIKVGSYLPYPVKLCVNGHEWAKQQLRHRDIGFTSLDNGFRDCEDPETLQQICDSLGPGDIHGFFRRWQQELPWPLTPQDRSAGFQHSLSIWQLETSLTQVFDKPVHGRYFFDQLIRDNLDIGRPDRLTLLFPSKITRATKAPRRGYRTRVITSGVQPSLHVNYKHSHVKQYFKENQALRTETTINDPRDFYVNKGVENVAELRDIGKRINEELLEVQRVSQQCVLDHQELDDLQRPTVHDRQRAPALRFADPRIMAIMAALCLLFQLPWGFRNRELRDRIAPLLGVQPDEYTAGKMTYDLRRFRLKGIIERIEGTNRYRLTSYGRRVAFMYTKLHVRILRPAWAAILEPPNDLPRPLRAALRQLDKEINSLCEEAQMGQAA